MGKQPKDRSGHHETRPGSGLDINEMIHEEVGSVHVSQGLDHLIGDETRPHPSAHGTTEADLAGREAVESTRMVKLSSLGADPMLTTASEPGRMQPLPRGLNVHLVDQAGRRFPLEKALTIIGRVPQVADIVFPDDDMSRHHAAISYAQGTFFLEDLESTNGTFVNNRRIRKIRISAQDVIRVGPHELRLVVDQA